MLDELIRSRLEQLNRGLLPAQVASIQPLPAQPSQPVATPKAVGSPLRPRAVKPIEGLIRRGTVAGNDFGEHLRIVVELEELWPGGGDLAVRRHAQLIAEPAPPKRSRVQQELANLVQAFPSNLLLVDLETCGLAGSSLFLIGLLRCIEGKLCVELLLARNYSEERAVLASFWQLAQTGQLLATYNGKSFDWPMIVDRSARHLLFRGSRRPELAHVDLLHHARRRWRKQLPNCKLQTIERHICGRGRSGDIPGSQIPAAYQQFVRTGKDHEMNAILLHNAIDLVTILDISIRLAGLMI